MNVYRALWDTGSLVGVYRAFMSVDSVYRALLSVCRREKKKCLSKGES